jgi:hypothetical protein
MQEQTIPQPVIAFTDLSIDEANAIFAALDQSELSHKVVTKLVAKLVAQANAQLNPAPPAEAAKVSEVAEALADAAAAPGLSEPE